MRIKGTFMLGAVAAAMLVAACASDSSGDQVAVEEVLAQSQEALVGGASTSQVAVGAAVFLHGFPNTKDNGRACATCHVPGDHFQLTPAHVQERWEALQAKRAKNKNADDPLFRSIDANDFAEDFTNLKAGLVRVTLDLPANVDIIENGVPSSARKVDVWRSVPTIENVGIVRPATNPTAVDSPVPAADPSKVFAFPGPVAPPNTVGITLEPGFQLDGRVSNLNDQAFGALKAHSQVAENDRPDERFLDAVSAFQKNVFSSWEVARFALEHENDPSAVFQEPALNEQQLRGKGVFEFSCAICHGGASQTERKGAVPANFHTIQISKPLPPYVVGVVPLPPPVPLTPKVYRTYVVTATGQVLRDGAGNKVCVKAPNGQCNDLPSTDPGVYLTNGRLPYFNTFDVPQLRGIKNTAPYFHDNSANTLEQVMQQYDVFWAELAVRFPTAPGNRPVKDPADRAALIEYLKTL